MTDDLISRQAAIDKITKRLLETAFNNVGIKQNVDETLAEVAENRLENWFNELPPAQPGIIYCKDCKHNPKHEWFGCPMSHLNEKQRPETAWCWKGERRTDDKTNKGSSC